MRFPVCTAYASSGGYIALNAGVTFVAEASSYAGDSCDRWMALHVDRRRGMTVKYALDIFEMPQHHVERRRVAWPAAIWQGLADSRRAVSHESDHRRA